jgi:hypothetical protein
MVESLQQFERPIVSEDLSEGVSEQPVERQDAPEQVQNMEKTFNNSSFTQLVDSMVQERHDPKPRTIELAGFYRDSDTRESRDLRVRSLRTDVLTQLPTRKAMELVQFLADDAQGEELLQWLRPKFAEQIVNAREKGEICFTVNKGCTEFRAWFEMMDEKNFRYGDHIGSFSDNDIIMTIYTEDNLKWVWEEVIKDKGYTAETLVKKSDAGSNWDLTMTRYRRIKQ